MHWHGAQHTEALMQAYENVFGPAARDVCMGGLLHTHPQDRTENPHCIFGLQTAPRDVKFDTQRQKCYQRLQLPDALKGAGHFLIDRVDGLITDATSSPFTKNILPYVYMRIRTGRSSEHVGRSDASAERRKREVRRWEEDANGGKQRRTDSPRRSIRGDGGRRCI